MTVEIKGVARNRIGVSKNVLRLLRLRNSWMTYSCRSAGSHFAYEFSRKDGRLWTCDEVLMVLKVCCSQKKLFAKGVNRDREMLRKSSAQACSFGGLQNRISVTEVATQVDSFSIK